MFSQRTFSAFSTVTFLALAVSAVPADPTVTAPAVLPRQNNAQFIGFIESGGTWYSETCNAGLTWYQDGKYAQCCPATLASCYAPTACVSGSLIYPLPGLFTTSTVACTSNFNDPSASICNTAFIFENMGDSNPRTDIVCGPSSVNWSYYRALPASVTAVSSNAAVSMPQPVSTGLGLSNSNKKSKKKGSKAWIAGAVIGPIVGLALIAGLILLCLRRRKNKKVAPQQGSAAMATVHPSQPPAGVAGHTDAKPQPTQQHHANPDPYVNQGLYAAQGNYSNAPSPQSVSHNYVGMPPQNPGVAPYNTGSAPYNAPVSPPPQQTYYGNDVKQPYVGASQGGQTSGGATSGGQARQTAELGGTASGASGAAPSELPPNKTGWLNSITS